ncbi:MAG: hypothetical protein ABEJ65_10820 [bacterium]
MKVIIVLGGLVALPGFVHARTTDSVTCYEPCYFYVDRLDTGRFPELLGTDDPVGIVSWVLIRDTGSGRSLSGSIVLFQEKLRKLQRSLPATVQSLARHEYVVPRPTKWWSWHFRQSGVDSGTIQTLDRRFKLIGRNKKKLPSNITLPWAQLERNFGDSGHPLGEYYLVKTSTSSVLKDAPETQRPASYAIFQSQDKQLIVTGDLAVGVNQIGPSIRFLYRHEMHFLSLAYNSSIPGKRLYFLHFAGAGSRGKMIQSVKSLFKFLDQDSKYKTLH